MRGFSKGRTLTGLAMASLFAACAAQAPSDYALQQRYGSNYLYQIPSVRMGNAWTMRPWLDRTSLYAQARTELESRFAKPGFDADGEFARLAREAAESGSALAQFRWAILGFLRACRDGERGVAFWETPPRRKTRAQIRWALALAPDPADPEYDRIRFIYEAAAAKADVFRELGKRLVLRWPGDDALLRNQAENLGWSSSAKDVDRAIAIADALLKKHPDRLRYVAFKGDIYQLAWLSLHRREDALADIEWTERYLRMAGPNAYNREALRRATDSLKKQLGLP